MAAHAKIINFAAGPSKLPEEVSRIERLLMSFTGVEVLSRMCVFIISSCNLCIGHRTHRKRTRQLPRHRREHPRDEPPVRRLPRHRQAGRELPTANLVSETFVIRKACRNGQR